MEHTRLASKLIEVDASLNAESFLDGLNQANGDSATPNVGCPQDRAPRLRIRTLGDFEVVVDNQPLPVRCRTHRRPLEVLKGLIALGPGAVSRAALAAHLWPQSEGDDAQNACQVALHRLRRILGDRGTILVQDGTVRLAEGCAWIDAHEFRRFVERIDCHHPSCAAYSEVAEDLATQLLSLYPGHFLPQDEAPWVLGMREQLRSRFVRAAIALGNALQAVEAFDAAAELARRGIELDPLVERFYAALMRALGAQGRIAEALDTYRRCREILSVTLGIGPSAEIRSSYTALLHA